MSLREFCQRKVIGISPESNIGEACRLMEKNNIGCLVVQERGKLCGILTDRDIALKVTGANKDPRKTKTREIMSQSPIRTPVDKDLRELTNLMRVHHVRRVLIRMPSTSKKIVSNGSGNLRSGRFQSGEVSIRSKNPFGICYLEPTFLLSNICSFNAIARV